MTPDRNGSLRVADEPAAYPSDNRGRRPLSIAEIIADLDPTSTIRFGGKSAVSLDPSPKVDPTGIPPFPKRVERACKYLSRIDPAISGHHGSNPTYKAARVLVHGFCLDENTALSLLLNEYNPKCNPSWSEKDLAYKVRQAASKPFNKPRGWLLVPKPVARTTPTPIAPTLAAPVSSERATDTNGGSTVAQPEEIRNEADDDPHRLARVVLSGYQSRGRRTLLYWKGEFHAWDGCRYKTYAEKADLRPIVNRIISGEMDRLHLLQMEAYRSNQGKSDEIPIKKKVTDALTSNTLAAMAGQVHLIGPDAAPAWVVEGGSHPEPRDLVAAKNGLVNLPDYAIGAPNGLMPHTVDYLNFNSLGFAADPKAPPPTNWEAFLHQLWPDEPDNAKLLQEWFGYLLTPDTRIHKILLMVGPARSGKGTINRVLQELVGAENCCNPTLGTLGGPHGLETLIRKTVAVIEDARLSGKTDTGVVIERLLTISGGGGIDVNPKGSPHVTSRLNTRFVIATNELPNLADASGAMANRWCVLSFTQSFLGREDHGLQDRLLAELPSIFNWAVAGWQRLRANGMRFTTPAAGMEVSAELADMASPVGEFVRERCIVGPEEKGFRVPAQELYAEWRKWCESTGRDRPGTIQVFGKHLRAFDPKHGRKRDGAGSRGYFYPCLIIRSDFQQQTLNPVVGYLDTIERAIPSEIARSFCHAEEL